MRCSNSEYLALKVHHGLLEGLRRSPLVVTQNGNRSVGTVIGKDFRWDVIIRCKVQESGEQPVFSRAKESQPASHHPCNLTATAEVTLLSDGTVSTLRSNHSAKSLTTSIPDPNFLCWFHQ